MNDTEFDYEAIQQMKPSSPMDGDLWVASLTECGSVKYRQSDVDTALVQSVSSLDRTARRQPSSWRAKETERGRHSTHNT